MPESTALKRTKSLRVLRATMVASVVLPEPGGPQRIIEPSSSRSICAPQRLARPQDVKLADEFFDRLRPHAVGKRRRGGGLLG